MNVYAIGASRNIGYHAARRLLGQYSPLVSAHSQCTDRRRHFQLRAPL